MPIRIDSQSADFASRFSAFLAMKREVSADVDAAVRAIVDDVRTRGDAALIDATARFDRLTLDAGKLRISADEITAAVAACDATTLDALKLARQHKVVVLPHLGSATHEGRADMGEKVIVNIKTFMDGHKPPDRVLPSML